MLKEQNCVSAWILHNLSSNTAKSQFKDEPTSSPSLVAFYIVFYDSETLSSYR